MRGIVFSAALAVAFAAAYAQDAAEVNLAPAMREAEEWLALVDAGDYGASWESAAAAVRAETPRLQWEVALQELRRKLGGVERRKLRSATYARDIPGAPPGEYFVIQFDTAFAARPLAVETVTPVRQKDGRWRVSAYFIR